MPQLQSGNLAPLTRRQDLSQVFLPSWPRPLVASEPYHSFWNPEPR